MICFSYKFRLESLEKKYLALLGSHKDSKRRLQEAERVLAKFVSPSDSSLFSRALPLSKPIDDVKPKVVHRDSPAGQLDEKLPSIVKKNEKNHEDNENKKNEDRKDSKVSSNKNSIKSSSISIPSSSSNEQQKVEVYTNPWSTTSDDYKPVNFTAKSVLTNLHADIDLMS